MLSMAKFSQAKSFLKNGRMITSLIHYTWRKLGKENPNFRGLSVTLF